MDTTTTENPFRHGIVDVPCYEVFTPDGARVLSRGARIAMVELEALVLTADSTFADVPRDVGILLVVGLICEETVQHQLSAMCAHTIEGCKVQWSSGDKLSSAGGLLPLIIDGHPFLKSYRNVSVHITLLLVNNAEDGGSSPYALHLAADLDVGLAFELYSNGVSNFVADLPSAERYFDRYLAPTDNAGTVAAQASSIFSCHGLKPQGGTLCGRTLRERLRLEGMTGHASLELLIPDSFGVRSGVVFTVSSSAETPLTSILIRLSVPLLNDTVNLARCFLDACWRSLEPHPSVEVTIVCLEDEWDDADIAELQEYLPWAVVVCARATPSSSRSD